MDELSDFLKERYPSNYWTGDKDCNLLIWGNEEHKPRLCSLNIGIEYNPLSGRNERYEIRDYLNDRYLKDDTFKRLISYSKSVAQSHSIPISVIAYPSMRENYDGKWQNSERDYDRKDVIFYWFDFEKNNSDRLKGNELKEKIYDYIGTRYADVGTTKDENSHLSDYFHYWSRESLSKNIIKLDIDGMIIDDSMKNAILIEIKRSKIPKIPKWKPYVDDKANYLLELNYSREIGADFWLLHHEGGGFDEKEIVSFYDIKDVSESNNIDFLVTKDMNLECKLSGENSLNSRIERFLSK